MRLRVAARFSVSSAGGQCAVRPRASHIRSIRDQDTETEERLRRHSEAVSDMMTSPRLSGDQN